MPLELSNKLLQTLSMIIDKGLKAEAALAKSSGNWQNFGALTIEGIMADQPAQAQVVNGGTVTTSNPATPTPGLASGSAPAPAPDKSKGLPPRLEHLRQQVGAMKVEDRMLLRTVLDQVLHIMDLKLKIKRAEEAAAKPPSPPPEEGK
jgi:hypothetical protein